MKSTLDAVTGAAFLQQQATVMTELAKAGGGVNTLLDLVNDPRLLSHVVNWTQRKEQQADPDVVAEAGSYQLRRVPAMVTPFVFDHACLGKDYRFTALDETEELLRKVAGHLTEEVVDGYTILILGTVVYNSYPNEEAVVLFPRFEQFGSSPDDWPAQLAKYHQSHRKVLVPVVRVTDSVETLARQPFDMTFGRDVRISPMRVARHYEEGCVLIENDKEGSDF